MINIDHKDLIKAASLFTYTIFMFFYVRHLKRTNAIHMNDEPLTKQPLFVAAILIPFASFTTFGIISWLGHNLQLDAEGLNNFLNISKLPLGLLSLSIPLGVIVSNIHRTIQTDTQIREAQKKNKIDAFYAHRKNTVELFSNLNLPTLIAIGQDINLKFENCYSIYKWIYPNASTTSDDYSPSLNLFQDASSIWIKIAICLRYKNEGNIQAQAIQYNKIELLLESFHYQLEFERFNNKKLYVMTFTGNDKKRYELTSKYRNEEQLRNAIIAYWNSYFLLGGVVDIHFDDEFNNKTTGIIDYFFDDPSFFPLIELEELADGIAPKIKEINFLVIH